MTHRGGTGGSAGGGATPADHTVSSAPGSSREQDRRVGPLSTGEARRVAAKRLRMYRLVHLLLRAPLRWILRVRREGLENVPRTGGVILVVNHVSSFDPPAVLASVKRPYITLAKAGIMDRRVKRFFVETLGGMIRVDRSRRGNQAAVEAACLAVENGKLLAVWPEGGRSPTGRITRAHTGVARIAMRTGAPVVPVAVTGTHALRAKGATRTRWGTPVRVRFGPARRFPGRAHEADDRVAVRALADEIMLDVARLLGPAEVDRYCSLMERHVEPGRLPPEDTAGDEAEGASRGDKGRPLQAMTPGR